MKRLLLFLFALAVVFPAEASFSHNTQITHTGLKPVPNSFQIAKSHFLPDYQEGNFTFDKGDDISAACPTSIYKYTKNNCSYPNIVQSAPCGGKYRVCGCERVFTYSSEDCAVRGKEGGGESCTVRGGSDDGTTYYTSCVCPSSYTKLSDGQICTGTECSSAGERYCDRFENIQCTGAYMLCNNNQTGEGGFCNDKEGNKYTGCYCDEDIYPETDESCRYHYGTNAVGSGTSCNNGERWRSCSCDASCPSSHPDKSCGSLGISDETDDGCGGKCYKCNSCSPTCQNETNCPNGTKIVDNGCGGTCSVCQSCTPTCKNETGCKKYDTPISNGCGGTCTVCGVYDDGTAISFVFSFDKANTYASIETNAYSNNSPAFYSINWGDGSIDTYRSTGYKSHTYQQAGNYTVKIVGSVGHINQIKPVDKITALKKLNLSTVTFLYYTFSGGSNIIGSIPPLPPKLERADWAFQACTKLTGSVPKLPSSLKRAPFMFSGCEGLTGNIPTLSSGLIDGSFMFNSCSGLTGVTPVNGKYPYQYLSAIESKAHMINLCSDAVRQHFPTSWGGSCTSCQ